MTETGSGNQPVNFGDNHNNVGIASSGCAVLFRPTGEWPDERNKAVTIHVSQMNLDRYDAAVEDAIATCNGDVRGALKALIIANEFLERDLQKLIGLEQRPQ
jgi:hypothetical protein